MHKSSVTALATVQTKQLHGTGQVPHPAISPSFVGQGWWYRTLTPCSKPLLKTPAQNVKTSMEALWLQGFHTHTHISFFHVQRCLRLFPLYFYSKEQGLSFWTGVQPSAILQFQLTMDTQSISYSQLPPFHSRAGLLLQCSAQLDALRTDVAAVQAGRQCGSTEADRGCPGIFHG